MDITKLKEEIRCLFDQDASGHDYYHTMRVYQNAMTIAQQENCDREVVALGALLHDADDRKLFSTENYENARKLLAFYGASGELTEKVVSLIATVSFGGGKTPDTIEGKIVQDADRLDALGAIGIARTFAYGGSHSTPMYDPEIPPRENMTPEQYRNHKGTSFNHFYEKLLKLKDTMHTKKAKELAAHRHAFLETFAQEFLQEWEGKR
ncbi:MAG: HD domain-containing protein [Oscillospiraceae bacterium]|nr:HD domain-containing protein [Oscillospiraceae bacterium]